MHKNVRTADGEQLGNVAAEQGDSIVILSSGHREYTVPKERVEGFNGSEVFLDLLFEEMGMYSIVA